MAVIEEGIKICNDNGLCFGNYLVEEKIKVNDFEYNGDIYKVRTHNNVTRIEKNSSLLLETVPGAAIFNFIIDETTVSFSAEGFEDTLFTLELEESSDYSICIDNECISNIKTNRSRKISFNVELNNSKKSIVVKKN